GECAGTPLEGSSHKRNRQSTDRQRLAQSRFGWRRVDLGCRFDSYGANARNLVRRGFWRRLVSPGLVDRRRSRIRYHDSRTHACRHAPYRYIRFAVKEGNLARSMYRYADGKPGEERKEDGKIRGGGFQEIPAS